MAISFLELMEMMQSQGESPLEGSGLEPKGMQAIKSGLEMDEGFWENFLKLCGNTEAMSDLLEVGPDKITRWHSRVRKFLNDAKLGGEKERNVMLPTGDPGIREKNPGDQPRSSGIPAQF